MSNQNSTQNLASIATPMQVSNIKCSKCGRTKPTTRYFACRRLSPRYADGFVHVCKDCIMTTYFYYDPNTFIPLLRELDLAWIPGIYRSVTEKALNSTTRNANSILGRYIGQLRLGQYASYGFDDSQAAQTYFFGSDPFDDPYQYEGAMAAVGSTNFSAPLDVCERLRLAPRSAFEGALSSPSAAGAADSSSTFSSTAVSPVPLESMIPTESAQFFSAEDMPFADVLLTKEELVYLKNKWGAEYNKSQLLALEKEYLNLLQDFDIRTTAQKDYLRKLCSASLRYDEAMSQDNSDEAGRWSRIYSSLSKESGLQPIQGNEAQEDYLDAVGILVKMAEDSDDFIPKWDTTEPRDKLDLILNDYKLFVKRLVEQNSDIADRITLAANALKKQDDVVNNKETDESSEEPSPDDGLSAIAAASAAEDDDPTADLLGVYNELENNEDYDEPAPRATAEELAKLGDKKYAIKQRGLDIINKKTKNKN